jgi:hypothetical protein
MHVPDCALDPPAGGEPSRVGVDISGCICAAPLVLPTRTAMARVRGCLYVHLAPLALAAKRMSCPSLVLVLLCCCALICELQCV